MALKKTVKLDDTTYELLQQYKADTEIPVTAMIRKAVREAMIREKYPPVFAVLTKSKRIKSS